MSFIKVHRRGHQHRAVRLANPHIVSVLPPTDTVLPNSGTPLSSAIPTKPVLPVPISQVPQPVSANPTTTPLVVSSSSPLPVISSVLAPLVVSTISSSSVTPLPVTSSSSSSVVSTTPIVVPTTTRSFTTPAYTSPTTLRDFPATTFTPTTTSSDVPAATTSASGMKAGSIIGITAACIAGVAIVGVAGMWLLRRYFSSRDENDDHPPFQRHSWMRNSVALPEDAPSPIVQGPSVNPRPPTMIERKQTQRFANLAPRGYAENEGGYQDRNGYPQDGNMGMAYSGYQNSPYGVPPTPGFNPGQHFGQPQNPEQAFFSPIGSPPPHSPGVASFDESTPPVQHASYDGAAMGAAAYFSRPDTNKAYPDLPDALPPMPNPHDNNGNDGYATLDRSSVTPYQAQQYAEITKQLEPVLQPITEGAAPAAVHEPSPFEDPAPAFVAEEQDEALIAPTLAHTRVDSTPPTLPPMRTMSPVGAVATQPSIAQLANAFPATPTSPKAFAIPAPVATPSSPKSPSFKQPPPLSPAPSAQGQMVSVPDGVHVGRETPVQFGFNEPAAVPGTTEAQAVVPRPNPKRMSIASRKSIAKSGRPETLYDEEDAYGGF